MVKFTDEDREDLLYFLPLLVLLTVDLVTMVVFGISIYTAAACGFGAATATSGICITLLGRWRDRDPVLCFLMLLVGTILLTSLGLAA